MTYTFIRIQGAMSEVKKRGRPKQFDRDKTLTMATQLYWEKGLEGMSVNFICQATDVSKPSLYREFGNEEGLLADVIEHYAEHVMKPLKDLFNYQNSFNAVLHNIAERLIVSSNNEQPPMGCLIMKFRSSKHLLSDVLKQKIEAVTENTLAMYQQWFSHHKESLAVNVTPRCAAHYFDTQLSAAMIQMLRGDNPESVRKLFILALTAIGLQAYKV